MVQNLWHRRKLWAVQVLVICWTLLAPFGFIASGAGLSIAVQAAYAQSSVPDGWESYLDRPDILKVPAQAQNLDSSWQKLKDAHFSFIAQMLATYPEGTHFYFLARDSEHLYDVARLVTQGAPEAQRIHLLNISRANMRDSNLKAYLKENGISEETLTQGRQVLFIDTGFAGTIPRVIGESFPADLRSRLKTQLIVSSNPAHPSSRNFLLHLNPLVNQLHPSQMHGTIVSYEHMPRYTDRSSQLKWIDGRWHPLSPINGASDGSVSKTQSLRYMSDLKAEWEKVDVQQRFQAERSQIQELKKILQSGQATSQMQGRMEVLLKLEDPKNYNQLVAQVQDLFESKSQSGLQPLVSLQDLGIAIPQTGSETVISKKNELIQKYPDWAAILEDPDTGIAKLFQQSNWQMIGNLLDANVDQEINRLLIKHLYQEVGTGIRKDLQIQMIEKGDAYNLLYLAVHTFSEPHTKDMSDLLKLLIEKGDAYTLRFLAMYTFSEPHTKDMSDLLKLLIEKGDADTLQCLAKYTFSQPHTKDMSDLLKLLIEKGDAYNLQYLAKYTFSQPHTKDMSDLLKLLIEKGNADTLRYLAMYTFSQPHLNPRTPEQEVLWKSLGIKNAIERKSFIAQELQKIASPFVDKTKSLPPQKISSQLQPGDQILISNRIMKVIKKAGEGRRGVVFQVQAQDNKALYALKTMKNSEPETLLSLARESEKAQQWQALKIPHSKVLVQEKDFVLKTWIEGISGEQVIEKYFAGDIAYKPAAESILKLVAQVRDQGAYVGDFRPANLIWSGKAWIIIDSGSIQQGMTIEEAQQKWLQVDEKGPKFERRWRMTLPAPNCSKVLGKAG